MSNNVNVNNNNIGPFGDLTLTTVFIGGLAWETPKEAMRRYFQKYGEISEAVIIDDFWLLLSNLIIIMLTSIFFFFFFFFIFILSSHFTLSLNQEGLYLL